MVLNNVTDERMTEAKTVEGQGMKNKVVGGLKDQLSDWIR